MRDNFSFATVSLHISIYYPFVLAWITEALILAMYYNLPSAWNENFYQLRLILDVIGIRTLCTFTIISTSPL